nr:hypothetical protein BaRGS_033940 [Batillaria attramentaria]
MATRAGMAVRGDQLWNPNITWQPIPVHTRPQEYDRKLNMGAPCPRYDELYDIELQSPAVKAEEKDNKHDSTVAAVSQAMQVFNQKSPPYAAALLVELHQMSDGYKRCTVLALMVVIMILCALLIITAIAWVILIF